MRLLFVTGYGHLPDVVGGLQTTLHELCLALKERGVEPSVLCGYTASVHHEMARPRSDEWLGYPTMRMPDPAGSVATVAAVAEPDAIVVLTGDKTVPTIVSAMQTGRPVGVYIHNVEYREFGGVLLPDPDIRYFANSEFTSRRLRSLFGLESEVLYPLVRAGAYQFETSREKVLFINPSLPKGVEVFFRIAERLPDIAFRVAESWNLTGPWRDYCLSRAEKLDNVEWTAPTRDMENLYGSARLLLMPSVWEESYGRSAIEAQHSGIPVLASNRGGLPEAVGEGGMCLDADADIDLWVQTLSRICTDDTLYQTLSDKARDHARQVEHSADYIVAVLLTAMRAQVDG